MRFFLTASFCLGLVFSVQATHFPCSAPLLASHSSIAHPPITLKESVHEFSNLPEGLSINYKKVTLQDAPARLQQTLTPLLEAYTLYLLDIDGKDVLTALQNQIIKKHKAGAQTHVEINYEILYQSQDIFSLAISAYILKGGATQVQVPHTWIINYDMKEQNLIQRKNLFKVSEGEVLKRLQKLLAEDLFFDEKGTSALSFSKALVLPEQMAFLNDDFLLLWYQPKELQEESVKCLVPRAKIQDLFRYK